MENLLRITIAKIARKFFSAPEKSFQACKIVESEGRTMKSKITVGFVVQQFDDKGRCIYQEFVAGDEVNWETEEGEAIEIEDQPDLDEWYYPFEMKQPDTLMYKDDE